jgi:hypothetical protein
MDRAGPTAQIPDRNRSIRMPFDPSRRGLLGAAVAASVLPGVVRAADPETLRVGDVLARFDWLKPGVRTYLRSQQRGDRHVATDIWRRETRIEAVDGVHRLHIVQRWDGAGQTETLAERDSVFELGTFRPLTHLRTTTRDGARVVEGFRFTPQGVVGLDGVAYNSRADFSAPSTEPMYNFETDMEMLQTLPLAAGYAVSIPFYHPGGAGSGARYLWSVAGEDRLPSPDGREIDCWVVQTDYNVPNARPARFWLARATQLLVRQESVAPDGTIHRKTLLS